MRHSSFIEINLGHLAGNYQLIQELAPQAQILPMVKADAYGNGLIPVSQFLVSECGTKILGCASLGEALKIRNECPTLACDIAVFSDTEIDLRAGKEAFTRARIIPVLHQASDVDVVSREKDFSSLPLWVKLNTGMNRLGLTQTDLEKYLPVFRERGIRHLMTHFARSTMLLKNDDKTSKQFAEFQRMKKFLTDNGVAVEETSVSNSGAIEQQFGITETYVRPGLMLYGPPSVTEAALWKGKQISRFVTKVLSTFSVKKGTPVGYGVNVADKDSFFAVLPVGYGDGILTYYSGMSLAINGIRGKVFGRINMDMTFVQFDPEVADKVKINDEVQIWNHDNSAITDMAAQTKTHAYQIMCALSGRIPRIYKVK